MSGTTLFEKIWQDHAVLTTEDGYTLLYIGRHLAHDGSGHAFNFLEKRGLKVRRPELTFATPDNGVPTTSHRLEDITDPVQRRAVETLTKNAANHNVTLFDLGDSRQGIVHVVGP